jgi:hypothetical protein
MKSRAKKAGVLYLLMAIFGAFGIMYVPNNILVQNDAGATATNIIESIGTYRLSMLSNVVGQAIFIFLGLSFLDLFEGINAKLSKMLMSLVVAGVPIAILNTLNLAAAMMVLDGSEYLKEFNETQLNALSLLFINLYQYGVLIVQIFWGLWLLPLGLLCKQSNFIPKWIGLSLIMGCFSYLLLVIIGVLWPQFNEVAAPILMLPLVIGEFSIIGWLLIKGVK